MEKIMSKAAQEVLDSAMKLTDEERDELIAGLLDSTDIEDDEDEAAFRIELRRRIDEIESGAVKPIPWEVGRQMILDDKDVIPH